VDEEATTDVATEAAFRDANEQIAAKGEELGFEGPTPVLCECARRGCTTILRIDADEYERVRAGGARFVVAPGHERGAPGAEVTAATDRYLVLEKQGERGVLAKKLDPRSRGEAA
jgi:hypothetical protein